MLPSHCLHVHAIWIDFTSHFDIIDTNFAGTPADCTALGLSKALFPSVPDLVVIYTSLYSVFMLGQYSPLKKFLEQVKVTEGHFFSQTFGWFHSQGNVI